MTSQLIIVLIIVAVAAVIATAWAVRNLKHSRHQSPGCSGCPLKDGCGKKTLNCNKE